LGGKRRQAPYWQSDRQFPAQRTAMTADVPRARLSELAARFGDALGEDAARCQALLSEACGDGFGEECAVLLTAIEHGVTGDLLRGRHSSETPGALLNRLCSRLEADAGLSSYPSRWSVECWALALRVVPESDRLMIVRVEGLAPLIELAGADGVITTAELNHLIGEAKSRGVSETDARAYLTKYAATRGWQIERPQNQQVNGSPSPPASRSLISPQREPQPQPQPQPQPFSSPGSTTPQSASPLHRPASFPWIGAAVASLAAAGIFLLIATIRQQPQGPTPAVSSSPTDIAKQARRDDAEGQQQATERQRAAAAERQRQQEAERQRAELADRDQRTYNAAKGSLYALRAYLSDCSVCAFAVEARTEISKLVDAEQEERTYNASRGNLYALRAYVNICKICTFESAARTEISTLETPVPRRRASSIVLCGRSVDYVIDATGANEAYRSFLGVWTGAAWNSRICGGLIVETTENDGNGRIRYIYGPLPGQQFPWKEQQHPARIQFGELTFQDEDGGNFKFKLAGSNVLNANFLSINGLSLHAVLTREPSSVP
jgi:hypothetical protein